MPKYKFSSNLTIEQRTVIYKFWEKRGPNATARKSLKLVGKRLERHQVKRIVKQHKAYLAEQLETAKAKDTKKGLKRKNTPIR